MNIDPYLSVIEDLSRELPADLRYARLLKAIHECLPCDAIGLLSLQQDMLKIVGAYGLLPHAAERRFKVEHHPRFEQILTSPSLVRFPSSCDLPDPYDGLVAEHSHQLHIHDCMGVKLEIEGKIWGILTFDSLTVGEFNDADTDLLTRTVSVARAVISAVRRVELLEQKIQLDAEVTQELNREGLDAELIGQSPAMNALRSEIDTVCRSDLSVLVLGETGVGKELVARLIHQQSLRFDQPFVHINCAALPEQLAESELFGHVKGAFTGAEHDRKGRFQLANGGTLFLDEVGELSLTLQAKLLRALQLGEIQPVGSDETITVDVRVLAATNRELEMEVKNKKFRADLYHRLSVYPIKIPALRERSGDVVLLADYFLERNQVRLNVDRLRLSSRARLALEQYSWPGNIRELEHVLSRAALKAQKDERARNGSVITIDVNYLDLETNAGNEQPLVTNEQTAARPLPELSLKEAVDLFKHDYITQHMTYYQGNMSAVARALKVDRSNLFRTIQRLNIDKQQ